MRTVSTVWSGVASLLIVDTGQLHHFQHFDFYIYQARLANSRVTIDAVNDERVDFAGKVAFHNLDFYASFTKELQQSAEEHDCTHLWWGSLGEQIADSSPNTFRTCSNESRGTGKARRQAVATICPDIKTRVASQSPPTNERRLWWELCCCLLSSRVPFSVAVAAADAVDAGGLLVLAMPR